jgi:hypothetical protein
MRYKKQYTVKQWRRFKKILVREDHGIKYNVDLQELMCKKYNITIIDYMTPRERKIQMIKTFFEKAKSVLQGIKSALDKIHESNQKRKTPKKRKKIDNIVNDFTMNEKEYFALTGRSTEDDLDTITCRGKKPNMSFIMGRNSRDYSALLGKPSRKRKRQKKNVTNLEKFWGKRK